MAFNVSYALDGTVAVIEIPERLDAGCSNELKEKINAVVNESIYNIVIDLSKTNFIDSSGLGALVSKISVCKANGGDIKLASPGKRVFEILQITHLDKVLNYYHDLEEAVNSFESG
ncbi:anti-sigma-factor antagonist [Flexistipes sinusarabici DSM 4947]|uniref:Anti-sigma factor antagonist n=2 Tax=Flexistipes sinusarabici TaxID=2352 RepID=F8E9G4_FLESM|nr:STAS domain-containing protein [Flexistipes sinusarabici]AEI15293.1 anti-sigma-factor antagonist [Flexistipes sinusarabici DSM 4947]HCW93756.1 anti-sigma factor antagonist [Flexistipes sinusarabici]